MAKIQVRAYFFNAKTDYLPYYKEFKVTIANDQTLKDLLQAIKEQDANFSFPQEKLLAKIDSITLQEHTKIDEIISNFGNEFTINPVSFYRSMNGLIIDDSNFLESYKILEEFCDREDFEFYNSLYGVHFASSSYDYKKDYIGDAIFILADHLISKYPQKKKDILTAIQKSENGLEFCEYENLLLNSKDYSEAINRLKKELLTPAKESLFDKLQFIGLKEKNFTLEDCNNKAIAYYHGSRDLDAINEAKELIEQSAKSYISFSKATRLAGQSIFETNPSFALKKAAAMLLDAYDSSAEVLLFAKQSDRDFFRNILAKCERVVNREINLELFSLDEFKEKSLAQSTN